MIYERFKIKNLKPAYDALRWNGDIDNGEGLVYDSYRKVLNNLRNQDKESPLPESLFFFGLKDALYQLSKQITDTKKLNFTFMQKLLMYLFALTGFIHVSAQASLGKQILKC